MAPTYCKAHGLCRSEVRPYRRDVESSDVVVTLVGDRVELHVTRDVVQECTSFGTGFCAKVVVLGPGVCDRWFPLLVGFAAFSARACTTVGSWSSAWTSIFLP